MRRSDLVFFLSGAAALAYESIWARLLIRLVGAESEGTALILAVFMAGLGLGAFAFARVARSTAHPRRWFAALEVGTALWAAASPWVLGNLDPVEGLAPRLALAGAALLPPTLAMGATFPLMGRLVIADRAAVGRDTSGFYGANTLGACAGALLAPMVLMPQLGLSGGLVGAALLDLAAAALVFTLPRSPGPVRGDPAPPAPVPFAWLAIPFAFGLSSLALEVLLTRILINVTGATVYAFAIVLAVFLLGTGLGSRQARDWLAPGKDPARVLVLCGALVPTLVLLGMLALRWQLKEADLFGILTNRMPGDTSTWALWASHALFAALALFPATIAFGAALPAAVAVVAAQRPELEPEAVLGRIYAANTLGALLGSLAAGFVLLPLTGPRIGVAVALLPCLLVVALVPGAKRSTLLAGAGAGLALGILLLAPAERPDGLRRLALLVGRNATVSVEETVESDGARVRSLRVNGKVEATTAPVDMRLQRLLAHIPALLHGKVETALVIGMGTGMTAGSLLDLPTLERLDVFEIEANVPRATELFGEWNGQLVRDPRTHVRIADGRHALVHAERRYDLITADPLHPGTRGSSDLFALEHFETMAARLAPGGIASQWLPLYELSTDDVRTILATWAAAFPHVSAWLTAYDLALVGSLEPLGTDLSTRPLPERVARHLGQVGVHSAVELQALLVSDDADLRALVAGVEPMTYDRPVIEFRSPFRFLSGYSTEILAWAARPEFVERLPAASRPRAREVRGLLEGFLVDLPSGLSAAAGRYGRSLLALPPLSQ